MKYPTWTMGQTEALLNRLGGEKRAKLFLAGKLVIVSPDQVFKPSILKIDRINTFDPAKFIGEGWTIWRGPKDGKGLEGDEEQDQRSLAITELDPTKLFAQTGLKDEETTIIGEEKRARLILEAIQADAKIAETLYKEEDQTTLKWLHKTFNLTWFEFLGTTLRDSDGNRCALYLYRDDGGSWYWLCYWLGSDRGANYLALGVAE